MLQQVVVLSPYPEDISQSAGGAARFIHQLLPNIATSQRYVLAQERKWKQQDTSITVLGAWQKNSPRPFFRVIQLLKNIPSDTLMVNFEYGAYGGIKGLIGLLLTLIWVAVAMRRRIIVIFHPALLSFSELWAARGHMGLSSWGTPLVAFFTVGMWVYAQALLFLSKQLIVFEENFRSRMRTLLQSYKISVIPHQAYASIESARVPNKSKTIRLLFFGFVVPYKGLEVLLASIRDSKSFTLTVAGGESPNALNKKYYSDLTYEMSKIKHVIHRGSLEESEIPKVFNSSDILVLPYTSLLASSGPLAWALATGTPFILSRPLSVFAETEDFANVLKSVRLNITDIVFDAIPGALLAKLEEIASQPKLLEKIRMFSLQLGLKRTPERIGLRYTHFLETV